MNLKKAFQYQKAIKNIMDELNSWDYELTGNAALTPAKFVEVKEIHKPQLPCLLDLFL